MKIAVVNFSGNTGKTTLSDSLLSPRMGGVRFAVETINAGASDDAAEIERLKGRQFGELSEILMTEDNAVVDVGASNVEDFFKYMGQFAGSHEEFDFFLVPTVSEKKQQADTINTIKTLAALGVPRSRILVVFNKVEIDDADDLPHTFAALMGFHELEKKFTLKRDAVIYSNEVFERLRALKTSIAAVVQDTTDYREQLRAAQDDAAKEQAKRMISVQRLAKSAWQNLDQVYATLFGKGK
ncbi:MULTISPECIES: StbB family protein [Pseudomonas]|jgi:MinD-like ATPase involved in chromosome partitioning or flagellar assembly|uniref:StbB family protein n=1 Tax=Pseudomonas TaxID=286 RepID=UPI000C86B0E6|nr:MULTISPECIES: StbB family protein [Pseudomonas]MBW1246698.1 plasmid stabilization protein [Pseudomonas tolaasii]PMU22947.1 plasmid stabilization protein [Pseudomonas sp. GP01-A9]PMU28529.1 plasmid stabilization protein [Pseudomonas sp. GP01-A13]PMU38781.1 plasmid stabilization protein [Pseudomonas sp. GP01-A8]PMU52399.1 plasmid stabilization protein [Pseudomonas sp. GP01-A6]